MSILKAVPHIHMARRSFLGGLGAVAAAGATSVIPAPVQAHSFRRSSKRRTFPKTALPKPITQVIDTASPDGAPPDPFRFIHFLLPGPVDATTPVQGFAGFGLDVDPSTIGDFKGFTAYAVVGGSATDGDGNEYDVEFDVRVMQGKYIGEDGKRHHGTFGFF